MYARLFGPTAFAAVMALSSAEAEENETVLVELQVVMQRHIDAQLIDGAMHRLDPDSGGVVRYYPTDAHSMIMAIGDDYVLCTDLATADGMSVPIDLYVTATNDGYRVYQTEIDNREMLEGLIEADLVARIR